jgi:hypothetical protein
MIQLPVVVLSNLAKRPTYHLLIQLMGDTLRRLKSPFLFCKSHDVESGCQPNLKSPNNIRAMRAVYAGLPSVRVEALRFAPKNISGERLLSMMKVDESAREPFVQSFVRYLIEGLRDAAIHGGDHGHSTIHGRQLRLL